MYKCPYCATQTLKSGKPFQSWKSVRNHTSKCECRTGQYFIDEVVGPIHYKDLEGLSREQVLSRFPGLKADLTDVRKSFSSRNILIDYCFVYLPKKISREHRKKLKYTSNYLLEQLQEFYKKHNCSPLYKDFIKNTKYPSCSTYERRFGSWSRALELAGLPQNSSLYTREELINIGRKWLAKHKHTPEARNFGGELPSPQTVINYFGSWNAYVVEIGGTVIESSYGRSTEGLDGNLYRSRIEAKLADWLYTSQISYEYETPYPAPYNRLYDFYLPLFDVYIELDGMGDRRDRDVIAEKEKINNLLGRRLLVLYPEDLDTLTVEKLLLEAEPDKRAGLVLKTK